MTQREALSAFCAALDELAPRLADCRTRDDRAGAFHDLRVVMTELSRAMLTVPRLNP